MCNLTRIPKKARRQVDRSNDTPHGVKWDLITLLISLSATIVSGCGSPKLQVTIERKTCESDRDFVFVPAGNFISGSDQFERDYAYQISAEAHGKTPEEIARSESELRRQNWFDHEPPRQTQVLPDFCIHRHLVTNAEYQVFVRETNHRLPGISETEYQQQGFLVHPYSEVKSYLWENGTYPKNEGQHPVVLVSYEDAIAYAQWRGIKDDRTYRLPTVEEWEKAARGTDGRYFPWGNQWYAEAINWAGSGRNRTSEISAYPLSRSIYGVENMAGNVFEFTSTLQQQGLQKIGIMKGCSWDDSPGFCRASYRHTRSIQSRHILFGFRLIWEKP
jgi:toxoflavin biosynthesis protein ToxD